MEVSDAHGEGSGRGEPQAEDAAGRETALYAATQKEMLEKTSNAQGCVDGRELGEPGIEAIIRMIAGLSKSGPQPQNYRIRPRRAQMTGLCGNV